MKLFSLFKISIVLIIIEVWLLVQIAGCGQYTHSDDHIPVKKCYGPNEEACIIYDGDMLCGYLI